MSGRYVWDGYEDRKYIPLAALTLVASPALTALWFLAVAAWGWLG